MKQITTEKIVKATGGSLLCGSGGAVCQRVCINSREVEKGDVFFALIGEKHDAHTFLPQVFENGCKTVVVSDALAFQNALDSLCEEKKGEIEAILVENTEAALQELASWYLTTFNDLKIIGVTGSTGKTSTKDMLYYILAEKFKTGKSVKNFNNLIGVPLSIFELQEDAQVAVLEMGMDHLLEIHRLVEITKPHIGIITNVGISHIETLGSRENICKAKLEITDFFDEKNYLIINEDYDLLTREQASGQYSLITTGNTGKNDYIVSDICDFGENGIEFTLEHHCKTQRFTLSIPGRHNAYNASLAVAAAGILGVSMEVAAVGLSKATLTEKRLSIKGKDGIKVIDDTYNASPASMKAAIDVLISTKGMRKVAVVSDMLGLGSLEEKYHGEVGRYAAESGVDLVVAIGERSKYTAKGAMEILSKDQVLYYETKEAFLKEIRAVIALGDVVLVKGSRAMAMEQIVKKILE